MFKEAIAPILDRLDSETWHHNAINALHAAEATPFTLKLLEQFAYQRERFVNERLNIVVGGIEFDNPLIVGAGWDKAGKAVRALHTLGFSGVEVGTVVAYAQPGNPKPRQFMIRPGVALNRLGFNSPGAESVAHNLEKYRRSGIPIGVSLGKNKEVEPKDAPEAHAFVARHLYEYASYFAINVSSPNTPGLRDLQEIRPLTDIVQAVNTAMDEKGKRKPTFVKISPDMSTDAVDSVIRVVADNGLAGIIATNTTIRPDLKAKYGEKWRNEPGGLSGNDDDFAHMAREKVAHIYRETAGRMEIIGCGGIHNVETALNMISAGARVIQVVTAIRSEGLSLPGKINREILNFMQKEGINNLDEIIGNEL